MGAYSRWMLVRGWALIKFSPFSASVVCLFCNKKINGNNKKRRCNNLSYLSLCGGMCVGGGHLLNFLPLGWALIRGGR